VVIALVRLLIVGQEYARCARQHYPCPSLSLPRYQQPVLPGGHRIIAWLNTCVEITKNLNMPVNNVIKQRQIMTGWKFIS